MKIKDTGTFEEMARRREGVVAGVSPGYDEAAQRRQEAKRARQEVPEEAPPPPRQAITRSAVGVVALCRELGVPGASAAQLAELSGAADEEATFVAVPIAHVLSDMPGVATGARVSAPQVKGTLDQCGEMSDLRLEATHLRRCVMDMRRGTSGEVRRQMRLVVEWIQRQLKDPDLGRAEREMLRSDAAELLACWEELQAGPQAERDKTLAAEARHDGLLLAEDEQREALGTMIAFRSGAEVSQEEWDRAAEVYDSLPQKAAAASNRDRRGRGR